MASHLPGFPLQPAVAVGMGAAAVAVLKLPLPAVVIATLLTTKAGPGLEPLIIVGVVVSYIVTLLIVLYEPTYAPMQFTLIARGIGESVHALAVGERLLDVCRDTFQLDEFEASLSVSVGAALIADASNDEDALRNADLALYAAKSAKRGSVRLFEAPMREVRAAWRTGSHARTGSRARGRGRAA